MLSSKNSQPGAARNLKKAVSWIFPCTSPLPLDMCARMHTTLQPLEHIIFSISIHTHKQSSIYIRTYYRHHHNTLNTIHVELTIFGMFILFDSDCWFFDRCCMQCLCCCRITRTQLNWASRLRRTRFLEPAHQKTYVIGHHHTSIVSSFSLYVLVRYITPFDPHFCIIRHFFRVAFFKVNCIPVKKKIFSTRNTVKWNVHLKYSLTDIGFCDFE